MLSNKQKVILIVVTLCALAVVLFVNLFPFSFTNDDNGNVKTFVVAIVSYSVCCVFAVYVASIFGVLSKYSGKLTAKEILLCSPFLLIALNNFPYYEHLSSALVMNAKPEEILLFATTCLLTCIFEETLFRGLLFGQLSQRCKNKKDIALCILICSGIFALSHLLNLVDGASLPSTLLQVGYSFLIGAMLSVVLLRAKNIWLCVVIHCVFNFTGMSLNYFAVSYDLSAVTIVITATVSVFALVWAIVLLRKTPFELLICKSSVEERT